MHYGFDTWMTREFPEIPFERYSDDIVVHCVSERQARFVREAIARRLVDVGLQLHPGKTRLVYCKDSRRRRTYEHISFTFCGYTFTAPQGRQQAHAGGLHRLSARGQPGQADGDEPPGAVLAAAAAHHRHP